jgi:hypothetical protein
MKTLVTESSKSQRIWSLNNRKSDRRLDPRRKNLTQRRKNFIQNDEWRTEAKTRLDLELFEIHLLDFGSCG